MSYAEGQHVLTTISGQIARVVIESADDASGFATVRRAGLTEAGYRYPPCRRCYENLHAIVSDPLTMNVAADWLDENGEAAAAAKLRAAFPLPKEE